MSEKSWDSYNQFLLEGALDRHAKSLARYELFRMVTNLPGDIVECGVFKGAGALHWAKLLQIFAPLSNRRVVGFDTFDGYPEDTTLDYEADTGRSFQAEAKSKGTSPESIMAIAAGQKLEHRLEFARGDGTMEIPAYVKRNPGFRVALLNLDFDVYEPSLVALETLYPLMVPGGVIAFDEYAKRGWGESDAVDKFIQGKGLRLQAFPWTYSPSAYLIKP